MQSLNDEDITAVYEMKKDFQTILSNRQYHRQNGPNYSGQFCEESAIGNSHSSVSMQQFLEKECNEKLKHAELIEKKAQVAKLQQDFTTLQAKHQATCVQHELKLLQLNQHHDTDKQALCTLKDQLHKLLIKDEEMHVKLNDTRAELTQTKTSYEQKILAIQKEKYKAQLDIQKLEQESHSRLQELRNENLRQDSELKICQLELLETKEQLQHTLKRYNTTTSQLQEAEEARLKALEAEQRVKDLEQQLSELEGERTITRTMKNQLDRLNGLESENRKLKNENLYCKQTQDNVFLLREETDSLKQKLERSEQRCAEFIKLQIDHKDIKEKLDKWEKLMDSNTTRPLSPKELGRRVSDLQCGNASLLERQGLLQASTHSLEETLKNKMHQLGVLQTNLTRERAQAKEAEQLIVRLQRKLLLVSKDRDSYKNILESYQKEVTSNAAIRSHRRNIQQLQDTMHGYQRHITSLETELEHKAQELALAIARSKELETDLNQLKLCQQTRSAEADNKVMAQLREQVASLEKILEEVQEEKADLQQRLDRAHIQGVYEPENTKIVTLTMNPFSMARKRRREEIADIVEDNKRLKTRIELIEENQGDLDDITQQVSVKLQQSGVDSKQIQEFQDKILSAELKNQRLMEVFKKKSHELREVVYRLLGYMIQIPCDNQYRLSNMYADSPDDFLLFQQSTSGDLQLLESEYSTTLSDRMDTYLTGSNSLPAFLSSLTMDLFSHQTILQ